MRRIKKRQPLVTKGQINLFGVDDKKSGLGVAVRGTHDALNWAYGKGFARFFDINHIDRAEPADVNIIQFDPSLGLDWTRQTRARGYKVVAYWVFEGSTPFKVMLENWKEYDEIWVPSAWCARRLDAFGIKSHVIPHPLEAPEYRWDKKNVRNFTIIANSASNWNRKNVIGGVRAYIQAKTPDAQLRVHNINLEPHQEKELGWHQQVDPSIMVSSEALTERQMDRLWKWTDCIISLHRSEGFGLVLAEAMMRGIPVVATGYSGNTDFCYSEIAVPYVEVDIDDIFFPNGHWAAPDIQQAAYIIEGLYDGTIKVPKSTISIITEYLSPERIGNLIKKRVNGLRTDLSRIH